MHILFKYNIATGNIKFHVSQTRWNFIETFQIKTQIFLSDISVSKLLIEGISTFYTRHFFYILSSFQYIQNYIKKDTFGYFQVDNIMD